MLNFNKTRANFKNFCCRNPKLKKFCCRNPKLEVIISSLVPLDHNNICRGKYLCVITFQAYHLHVAAGLVKNLRGEIVAVSLKTLFLHSMCNSLSTCAPVKQSLASSIELHKSVLSPL